ncbi:DUF397 domain-containing protein [Nocardia sp. 2YAB30]|uniref:DUF397 domain-containing protein n=1 Tax=Nocardia sp. 2YAB30 TaxID=3233022 RepID=UPI003F98C101
MSTADRLLWRTSSYSGNGEGCVDVAPAADRVFVRHAKHHDHGIIEFSAAQWSTFVREARRGLASANGAAMVSKDGADTLVASAHVQLRFNEVEWTAFLAGADDGEFDFHSAAAK